MKRKTDRKEPLTGADEGWRRRTRRAHAGLLVTAAITVLVSGAMGVSAAVGAKKIVAVGAENQYANVIGQIGGQYVQVSAMISNPNTDPHTFEASPAAAATISSADLVVQNGLGYDTFMNKIEAASPNHLRLVIDVQRLLKLPSKTANPHLWYRPSAMVAVAKAVAQDLGKRAPTHLGYFLTRARRFDASLTPWYQAIAQIKSKFPGAAVATSEPVGDYLLQAAGASNRTPWTLQADIMNGVDPAPQEVSLQDGLLSQHRVRVFLYNQQVTDTLTNSFLTLARRAGIPVVALYETMPTPGYDYQTWMTAEARALYRALADRESTTRL